MGKELFNYSAKHIHVEGLSEARAHVVAPRDFGQLGPTRDKHHRNVSEGRVGSAFLEHGRTVNLRHVQVKKQNIWRVGPRSLERGGAVFGLNNIESLAAQKLGHCATQFGLVLGYHDPALQTLTSRRSFVVEQARNVPSPAPATVPRCITRPQPAVERR
jgi:hypothetical protein